MIPKIIHYCWFGKKRKPKMVRDCIISWEKHLPDYQIIEWNEKNTNFSHPFVKEAYQKKKWAFVSDYIRLEKIEQIGGIYLDTDVMIIKNLDVFLEQDCFFGAEDKNFINAALFGALPQNSFVKSCREEYDFLQFEKNQNFGEITIPRIITQKFRDHYNFKNHFDTLVTEKEVVIYPPLYFYPFPYEDRKDLNNYKKYISNTSFAVHLWSSSWVEYSEFQYFENREYLKGFFKMIWYIFNNREFKYVYFRKIGSSIKKSLRSK
ncbi:glycosyl transferase-like sugar-binding protein [Flavobacterium sp. 270]|uniref:glycosyltransferase n=1 Tax=Flavobacterium sp. 270 TaxID=2512114 RepID=UPI00106658F8|nr:glycosyltransferase [Flavobacterium sp. 270]TDW47147.1 glycosyl transferase-like sugar-binding protein [Flavobacterium sp. 270]